MPPPGLPLRLRRLGEGLRSALSASRGKRMRGCRRTRAESGPRWRGSPGRPGSAAAGTAGPAPFPSLPRRGPADTGRAAPPPPGPPPPPLAPPPPPPRPRPLPHPVQERLRPALQPQLEHRAARRGERRGELRIEEFPLEAGESVPREAAEQAPARSHRPEYAHRDRVVRQVKALNPVPIGQLPHQCGESPRIRRAVRVGRRDRLGAEPASPPLAPPRRADRQDRPRR